jgi:hypothetical protein
LCVCELRPPHPRERRRVAGLRGGKEFLRLTASLFEIE